METLIIPVGNYDEIVVPSGRGLRLSGSASGTYPSTQWWGQFAIFRYGSQWRLIAALTETPRIQEWRIRPQAKTLEISYPGVDTISETAPAVTVMDVDSWQNGARTYRKLFDSTYDYVNQDRRFTHDYMLTGSHNVPWAVENLWKIRDSNDTAVWCTNYRTHNFDKMYPDYTPKDWPDQGYTWPGVWQEIESMGGTVYPYINGWFMDENHPDYQLSRMVLDQSGQPMPYEQTGKEHLKKVCLSAGSNLEQVVTSAAQLGTKGIYLDATGSQPNLCWATDHNHVPGDPTHHINAIGNLITYLAAHKKVVTETFSEHAFGLAHGYLSLMRTGVALTDVCVPLVNAAFGHDNSILGWQAGNINTYERFHDLLVTSLGYGLPYPTLNSDYDTWALQPDESANNNSGLPLKLIRHMRG